MSFKIPYFNPDITPAALFFWFQTFFGRWSGDDLIKTRVIPISEWDMDANLSPATTPQLGQFISLEQIVGIDIIIYDDTLAKAYNPALTASSWVKAEIDGQDINIERTGGGFFDSTDFDDTSINRGNIVVSYTI